MLHTIEVFLFWGPIQHSLHPFHAHTDPSTKDGLTFGQPLIKSEIQSRKRPPGRRMVM